MINNCRVCGCRFNDEPLLKYFNMPAIAQHLPDKNSLKNDKGVDLKVVQCSGCGLVQLSSGPVSYYREVIRATGFSSEMKTFRKKQFSDFLKKNSLKRKKIIEIGCGCGEYLSIMNQYGAKAYGIEYGANSVKKCKEIGLDVSRGFVKNDSYRIKNAPFDAFFILSFLEHLPDPGLVLRGISNNLTDDAVGMVEVPNFDMILKKNIFSEFMRDHLFYFSKDTLVTTLRTNGFEVLSCEAIWHDYIISAIVKKRKKNNLSFFYNQEKKIKKEIENYISCFTDKKVAIWGAGHQAFAIMSMFKLSKKIKYVIDSATFKQNKYTPATHIPIVSPEKINLDPVEAIIVMSGSYSDEVAKIIREKYGKNIKVSILRDFRLEIV